MSWTYVEPCCGSASVALALLGARRPLLPYQGSKWRFRHGLKALFTQLQFEGVPRRVDLFDIGPWGVVAKRIIEPADRACVMDVLRFMERLDAREVYRALHQQPVPEDPVVYSAQFLFLQRLAYSGKAVGDPAGRWSSPGFNTSSAYGLPGTDRFGAVNPMIPSLIGVLEGYQDLLRPEQLHSHRAAALPPSSSTNEPTLVYLDPPYQGSTGYPAGDLSRPEVVALARSWQQAGAAVVVSESEAIPALVDAGWQAQRLDVGRKDSSRFRGKQEEWLTYCEPSWAEDPSNSARVEGRT